MVEVSSDFMLQVCGALQVEVVMLRVQVAQLEQQNQKLQLQVQAQASLGELPPGWRLIRGT